MFARLRAWFSDPSEPHRAQVLTAFDQLPAIPEADRMRTRTVERSKVKSFAEWDRRYGLWRKEKGA